MITPEQELTIILTAAECNIVFGALNEVPYRLAAPVIDKLKKQITDVVPDAFQQQNTPMQPPPRQSNGLDIGAGVMPYEVPKT